VQGVCDHPASAFRAESDMVMKAKVSTRHAVSLHPFRVRSTVRILNPGVALAARAYPRLGILARLRRAQRLTSAPGIYVHVGVLTTGHRTVNMFGLHWPPNPAEKFFASPVLSLR
jgi:hypothetical protein